MLRQLREQLGARWHSKIGKVETGRNRTPAQRVAVRARHNARCLQLARSDHVLRTFAAV